MIRPSSLLPLGSYLVPIDRAAGRVAGSGWRRLRAWRVRCYVRAYGHCIYGTTFIHHLPRIDKLTNAKGNY